jgi:hypothetical protein
MNLRTLFLSTSIILLCTVVNHTQSGVVDGVEITTSKAPWTMRILGNDLDITQVQAKPDERSAYFMMTSESMGLNVSVFIEPAQKCKTSEECRDYVLGLGNPAWGKFQDLATGKIGDFSYFEFYRPEVSGRPVKMLDMYAQYVADGYWIDLHISKVLYKKADHALFEKVVKAVSFLTKGGTRSSAFDSEIASGQSAASSWLGLWGSTKCRESYLGLSSITRSDNTEESWTGYCKDVNKTLGANRSRTLIAAAFTSSLPGKTERPVAVLAYHSDFPGRASVVEIIGLILEKDGSWVVTNYLPR